MDEKKKLRAGRGENSGEDGDIAAEPRTNQQKDPERCQDTKHDGRQFDAQRCYAKSKKRQSLQDVIRQVDNHVWINRFHRETAAGECGINFALTQRARDVEAGDDEYDTDCDNNRGIPNQITPTIEPKVCNTRFLLLCIIPLRGRKTLLVVGEDNAEIRKCKIDTWF